MLLLSVHSWLLLIRLLHRLLMVGLLRYGLLLINGRLLLIDWLLSVKPIIRLKLHWL